MKPILRVRQDASWASFMRETHCPPIQTSPRSGLSRPAMRLSSVVLPDPDGPMMPRNSPSATSRLRLRKTVISSPPRAKDLTTFRTCRIGSAAIRASEITTDEHINTDGELAGHAFDSEFRHGPVYSHRPSPRTHAKRRTYLERTSNDLLGNCIQLL